MRKCLRCVLTFVQAGSILIKRTFCVRIQMRGITRVFHQTDHYEDAEDNLVK